MLASPKEITPEWEKEVFGIHYAVTDVVQAIQELAIDEVSVEKLEAAVQKQPTGEYVEYWENGQMKLRVPYQNGKANGHVHGWYADGNDAFKGFFKDGVKQGIHITFRPPGSKKYPDDVRILTYNEQGQLDGRQFREDLEKGTQAYINYVQGKAEGFLEYVEGKETILNCYAHGKLQENPKPIRTNNKPPHRKDEDYVDEVTRECIQKIAMEYGVRARGSGAGMPFDVERISIGFEVPGKGTVERARKLIIAFAEKLVEVTNRHEKLRPYLREYPFTEKRADISVYFREGEVTHAFVGRKNIIFYMGEKEFEEPYAEAKKK